MATFSAMAVFEFGDTEVIVDTRSPPGIPEQLDIVLAKSDWRTAPSLGSLDGGIGKTASDPGPISTAIEQVTGAPAGDIVNGFTDARATISDLPVIGEVATAIFAAELRLAELEAHYEKGTEKKWGSVALVLDMRGDPIFIGVGNILAVGVRAEVPKPV